jgi:hypothetical protein
MTYQTLETPALEELKLKASQWLRENPDHPNFGKGLDKYRQIILELRNRSDRQFTNDIKSSLE